MFNPPTITEHQPYEAFPTIDLYMDQVLEFVTTELQRSGLSPAESALTATMVNNYVKAGVLPRPLNKRYNRDQLAQLMIITVAKSVLTLAEIKQLFQIMETVGLSVETVYTLFTRAFAQERRDSHAAAEPAAEKSAPGNTADPDSRSAAHPADSSAGPGTSDMPNVQTVHSIIHHVTCAFLEKLRAERLLAAVSEAILPAESEKKK